MKWQEATSWHETIRTAGARDDETRDEGKVVRGDDKTVRQQRVDEVARYRGKR